MNVVFRRGWVGLAAAAASLFALTPLQAQPSSFVCESRNEAYRECASPYRGRVELVDTLSGRACIEGRTWGQRPDGRVWVRDGCRGRFAQASHRGDGGRFGRGDVVRCESEQGRYRECALPGRGIATLVEQHSERPCIQGRTWGARDGAVWVSGGCRGDFSVGGGGYGARPGRDDSVICSSDSGRHAVCRWDVRQGRPRLVEQLSEAACREGFSWGYQQGQIWVDRGCRGRFSAR